MVTHIRLTNRAFAALEALPESIAFDIIRKLDHDLTMFPEMGAPLGPRFPRLNGLCQLIYKRSVRVIYDYDQHDETLYVLAIQDCRQKMPSPRDLKRDTNDI